MPSFVVQSVTLCFGLFLPIISIAQINSMTAVYIFTYPYLQLDPLVITENGLHLEIDPHGADKSRGKRVVCVTEEERGFAHAAVANDKQLEHVIKVLVGCVLLRGLLLEP